MPRRHSRCCRDDKLNEQGLPSISFYGRPILGRSLFTRANQDAGNGPGDRSLDIDPRLACQLADNPTAPRLQMPVVDDDVIARHETCDVPMHDMVCGMPSVKTNVDIGRPQG